ncbi:MAG: hypothetical protein ACWA5W_02520 [Phycisphaerales bacterium]
MINAKNIPARSLTALMLASVGMGVSVGSISGCATTQSDTERVIEATEHIDDPIRALQARAELELGRDAQPIDHALRAVFLPNSPSPLAPGSSAYRKAMLTPDGVMGAIVAQGDADEASGDELPVEEPDPRRVKQATKLYTQARALRQQGEFEQAIGLLEQAGALDPSAGEIYRELGDAKILTNDRVGALSAFEMALRLGVEDARLLVHLASLEASRGHRERAIRLAHQARQMPGINRYPLAYAIAGIIEGSAEIDAGYLRSGSTVLGESLGSFDARSRDVRWKREIIEIVSQQSNLWLKVGDAWSSLGADQQAAQAYGQAERQSGQATQQPSREIVARQIVSLLGQNQPAQGALVFLDYLAQHAKSLHPLDSQWARALGAFPDVGEDLGLGICQLAHEVDATPAIQRSLLGIGLGALSIESGSEQLIRANEIQVDEDLASVVLRRGTDDHDRLAMSFTIVQAQPTHAQAIGDALARVLDDPMGTLKSVGNTSEPSEQLIACTLGLALGRADQIQHLEWVADGLGFSTLDGQSASWLSAHAQSFAQRGLWGASETLIEKLADRVGGDVQIGQDAFSARLLATTLLVSGQPSRAWTLIQPLADDADAPIEDLVTGAQIAQVLGHTDSAISFLERAIEQDPFDKRIYQRLIVLRSPENQQGDDEELRYLLRQLATARPHSVVVEMIQANQLAQNGYLDEAQRRIVEINTQDPDAQLGLDFLLSLWKTMSTQDQPDAIKDGVRWMRGQLDAHPSARERSLRTAQGLLELNEPRQAVEVLDRCWKLTGSFEIARALESLWGDEQIRTQLPDDLAPSYGDSVEDMALDRLDGLRGISEVIEYASVLASRGTMEDAKAMVEYLRAYLPESVELLPAQQSQLSQVIFSLARTIEELNNEDMLLELIAMVETRSNTLGFQLSRIKVLLLSTRPELDMEGLIRAVDRGVGEADTDEQRNQLRGLPIQSLLSEDRTHEAIMLTARFATRDGALDPDYIVETFRLLAGVGGNSDLIGVLDLLADDDLLDESIELTTKELGTPDQGKVAQTDDERRANLAYTAAALATAFSRPDQAEAYYELSLSYDPNHPWSNNDYGYMLAERGERIEYAITLLERAAKALPEEASIIDSLGWVRYKTGVFKDVLDEQGQVVTEGAISLLARADKLDTARENATILLHLGDALWRGGEHERAITAWIGAEDIARSRIRIVSEGEFPNAQAIEAMRKELREIRFRIQDAESTGQPTIAPLGIADPKPLGNPNSEPAKPPDSPASPENES